MAATQLHTGTLKSVVVVVGSSHPRLKYLNRKDLCDVSSTKSSQIIKLNKKVYKSSLFLDLNFRPFLATSLTVNVST